MTRVVARWLGRLMALLLLLSGPAAAHLTPNSEIGLDFGPSSVAADIIIPQGEYAVATGLPVGNDPRSLAQARAYLGRHLQVRTPDGRPWTIQLTAIEFAQIAGPPDLHATAVLTPPAGASHRRLTIAWTAVVREMPSHFALFVIRSDMAGASGTEPVIAGAARAAAPTVVIDAGDASAGRELMNAVRVGAAHIVEGYDHLLFLLALMLPAPLLARAGRWRDPRPLRATLRQLALVVTAFTVGHSMTLIGATFGGWQLPVQPVEVAIAVSVLLSAIHAIRPIFPGYEPMVAGGFGLIHGLAFATLVANLRLGPTTAPLALLGFNLGIELVQLVIVAVSLPALVLLAPRPAYRGLRVAAASFAIVAAGIWIVARVFAVGDEAVAIIESLMRPMPVLTALLSVYALLDAILRRVKRRSVPA